MNTIRKQDIPATGTAIEGGFFIDLIRIDGALYGLVVAPKAEGSQEEIVWHEDYTDHPGANSFNDGAANTAYLAGIGSPLAKWATELRIGGFDDWYIPAQDELEIAYRALKPSTDENTRWNRSGINLSAIEPTRPYTSSAPSQTAVAAFQAGGAEAFETDDWHWSSTQYSPGGAWGQYCGDGGQHADGKDGTGRARAFRRFLVIE